MRFFKILFSLSLLAVLALAGWTAWFAFNPVQLAGDNVEFAIAPGSALPGVIRQLNEQGIRLTPWQFTALARATRSDTKVKAGGYQAGAGITPWALLKKITEGDYSQAQIAFIEGWTFRQMRDALDANPDVRHDATTMTQAELMTQIGLPGEGPEGRFFPDTYHFARGSSDIAILARAHRAMDRQLDLAWRGRAEDTPLATPYEALILASIVEKETGSPGDRPRVAAVFVNRMRAGMRLQTDPTVIYGMGERFDGNLRRSDLDRDTPFNTYTRAGLPPGPIAMPGFASLQAATRPARTQDLYFVARGDGSSQFSRSLEEHNRAVARYQKAPRRVQ